MSNMKTSGGTNVRYSIPETWSKYAFLGTILFLLYACFFNAFCVKIAYANIDAPCFENKYLMSLSFWIVCTCTFAITCIILMITIHVVSYYKTISEPITIITSVPCLAIIYLFAFHAFVMNVIGITELIYQFMACGQEVTIICAMVVVIILTNSFFIHLVF